MVSVLFACALSFQAASPAEEAWAQKLGRERSQFGDIPNSGPWKHSYVGQFGGTYILFPAGSSTERYYCSTSPGATRWRISKEANVSGKTQKVWIVFLKKGADQRIKKPGPLWRWAGGGNVVGSIPKQALSDFQDQTPLALYHANAISSFCQFIDANGKESQTTQWEPEVVRKLADGGVEGGFSKLPKTAEPYPITLAEREYVYRRNMAGSRGTHGS